jgi:hypothetical protein
MALALALALPGVAAPLAPGRRMGQPMLLIEGLLARREEELLTAIDTLQTLIFARFHRSLPRRLDQRTAPQSEKTNASATQAAEATQATRPKKENDGCKNGMLTKNHAGSHRTVPNCREKYRRASSAKSMTGKVTRAAPRGVAGIVMGMAGRSCR